MGAMTEPCPAPSPDQADDDGAFGVPASESDSAPENTEGQPHGIWDRAADSFARWRGGDARAMDDLVRTMSPVLWHVVRAYGLDPLLAEDVVQITWLTLLRRHESIHDPRAVAGWLTTSARREAWRTGRQHQRVRATDDAQLDPLLPVDESAEDRAQRSSRDGRLWQAVGALDERCRRLLRIVAFEERPDYARIAADLNMPIGSIGPTRGRCLGKLRTALEADGWRGDTRDL